MATLTEAFEFLSSKWLTRAESRSRAIKCEVFDHPVTATFVHYASDGQATTHTQVWCGGVLVGWRLGATGSPDALIMSSHEEARALFLNEPKIGGVLRIKDPAGFTCSIPPNRAELSSHLSACPPIPGATFGVHLLMFDHPFGPIEITLQFRDGLLWPGPDNEGRDWLPIRGEGSEHSRHDCLLQMRLPFLGGTQFLMGGLPFPEIAAKTTVRGDLLDLACFAGLLAPPEVVLGRRTTYDAVHNAVLAIKATATIRNAWYGLHASVPEVRYNIHRPADEVRSDVPAG
jgi:hypothetical protein